jgi:hypothetical protein
MMMDSTLIAAEIGKEATVNGAWIQAIAGLFAAILSGFVAFLVAFKTILLPAENDERNKRFQVLDILFKRSVENQKDIKDTLSDMQITQKRVQDFQNVLAHCRQNPESQNSWSNFKYIHNRCIDMSSVDDFDDLARELTETVIHVNTHKEYILQLVFQIPKIDPSITEYCLKEESNSKDLDMIGSKIIDVVFALQCMLANLRYKGVSFNDFSKNHSEEIRRCYSLCDRLDILVCMYIEIIKEGIEISECLELLCRKNLKLPPRKLLI